MTENQERARIVTVTSNTSLATELEQRLMALGYGISAHAMSTDQGLVLIQRHQPDLVILDTAVQGDVDGIKAAETIRDKWNIPTILLIDQADVDCLKQAQPLLSSGFLIKPIQEPYLKITLEMTLNGVMAAKGREKDQPSPKQAIEIINKMQIGLHIYHLEDPKDSLGHSLRAVFCNPAAADMAGIPRTEMEGKTIDENFPFMRERRVNDEGKTIPEIYAEVALSGIPQSLEQVFYGDERSVRATLAVKAFPLENNCVGATFENISKRVKTELELKESEERFRNYFDADAIGRTLTAVDGRLLRANHRFCEMLGYRADELTSLSFDRITYQEDLPASHELVRCLLAGEKNSFRLEKRYVCKNGDILWADVSTTLIYDDEGRPLHFFTGIQDISEQKRMFAELRARESFLDRVIEQSPIATFISDTQGTLLRANPALKKFLNLTDEQLVGKYNIFKDTLVEKQGLMPLIRSVYEEGKSVYFKCDWNGEDIPTMDLKGSNSVSIEATMFPIHSPDGELTHAVLNWIDVTDHKKTEQEKESLQAQLQQALKMEAVGTLAGGIAHDFNNLLQAISGHAQLILLDINESSPIFDSLNNILISSQRAKELIRQLLLFSRKVEAERRPVDLNHEIENAKTILERTIPKMIHIDLQLGPDLWKVNADPVQIEQVLLNLGKNASDAMPEGGTLTIETANITLDKEFADTHIDVKPGSYVLLTVADTGTGMGTEVMKHIFDPFYTTKEIGLGTGLGLASVYGIVKSHGGQIICYSEIDRGTIFRIYWPSLAGSDFILEFKPLETRRPQGGSETILVVDDEEQIRGFASTVLKKYDYSVLTAGSGEEAVNAYLNHDPKIDLIILDIGMPGMGGHRCFKEIIHHDPSAKVLIASGYSMNGQIQKTLDAGAAGYVGKPYKVADLLNKVREVLDGRPTLNNTP